jgi:hypothetical protein
MIAWYWILLAFMVGVFIRELIQLGTMFLSWVLYKILG